MKDKENRKTDSRYAMIIIAGMGLVGISLGLGVNLAGLFFTPLAEAFGVGRGTAALTLTVYNMVQAFTGVLSPKALQRFGLKNTVRIGFLFSAGSAALICFCHKIIPVILLNAVRGFAAGLTGGVAVSILVNEWFRSGNGTATSLAMSFSGILSAVLSPVLDTLIRKSGWQTGMFFVTIMTVLLYLPALLFPISLRPAEVGMTPRGVTAEEEQTAEETKQKILPMRYILVMIYAALISAVTAMPSHFSGAAELKGFLTAGAAMTSICMVTNTAGKLILGYLLDRIGTKKAVSLFALLVLCGDLLLLLGSSEPVLYLSAALFGMSYSMTNIATPMLTREMFGTANYSEVYPKMSLAMTLAGALFASVTGWMYDLTGSYTGILLLFSVFLLGILAILMILYGKTNKENGK